jgi:phosphomannomutase/phosphoglucomutase
MSKLSCFKACDDRGKVGSELIEEIAYRIGRALSELINSRIKAFLCSGDINYKVKNTDEIINKVRQHFESLAFKVNETDGLSLEFTDRRLNLRSSNTEPVLCLDIESKNGIKLVEQKLEEIESLIQVGS